MNATHFYQSLIIRTRESAVCRFLFWTGLALIIWVFSSKGLADVLIYGAFIFALIKAGRGAAAWKQPAGIAFAAVLLYMACSVAFSVHPYLSARDFVKFLKIAAGAFAIPVVFNTESKIKSALLYSATAIAAALAYDLVRLRYRLGPDMLEKAREFEPFILNHSNVASIMAGAAFFVFLYFFWTWRRRPFPAAACAAGMLICMVYLVILASRGPQIAFVLACFCIGFLIPGKRGKLIWAACAAAVIAIIAANVSMINPRFLEESTMANLSDRDKVWSHTRELINMRPWFGHGYGKRNFVEIYYSNDPPEARFEFPHTHQFWLKILFESGWIGFALNFTAWLLLAMQISRRVFHERTFENRLLPGIVGLILLLIHLYGLGDYPDHVAQMLQFWLIPVALTLTYREKHLRQQATGK